MAETQVPTLGYHDEFHFHNGTTLYKLKGVKEIDPPVGGTREQIETTDLDASDWRRTYTSGYYEDVDFEVVMNYRPLSTTDTMMTAAATAGDVRAFKIALAKEDGTLYAQITGTAKCTGYKPGRITVGGLKEATASFRAVTVDAVAAYAA